jgi:hypothetical protein
MVFCGEIIPAINVEQESAASHFCSTSVSARLAFLASASFECKLSISQTASPVFSHFRSEFSQSMAS